MPSPQWFTAALTVAVALYLLSATLVISGRIRYDRRERLLMRLAHAVDEAGAVAPDDRFLRARIATVLASANIRAIARLIAEGRGTLAVQQSCSEWLVDTGGEARLHAQAARGRPRWRRIAALRILALVRADLAWPLLERALEDPNAEIARTAVAILGQVPHRRSTELLMQALRDGRWPRSYVAAFLQVSSVRADDLFASLFDERDPALRCWGARLAAKHITDSATQARLITLAGDVDPSVRKAAVESLGDGGVMAALPVVQERLDDPAPFVRAEAARALGHLTAIDAAPLLAAKLCDDDWWVRDAAKRSLIKLGRGVEPVLLSHLSDKDTFARNHAAEVLQHFGTFERLLIEEATERPDHRRQAALAQLADGDLRVWDAVLAHLPQDTQQRLSPTLRLLGLRAAAAEESA